MKELQFMDVTLRESVYLPECEIPIESACSLVASLLMAGVDFVEVGYAGSQGDTKYHSVSGGILDLMQDGIPEIRGKLSIMLHPQHFSDALMPALCHESIGLIRLCVQHGDVLQIAPMVDFLKGKEKRVSINLMRASTLSMEEILEAARLATQAGADVFYVADSNGAFIPSEVLALYRNLRESTDVLLGFHPHDNLHLGAINSIAAIKGGADILDGSIAGYGKGLANTSLLSVAVLVERYSYSHHIRLERLYGASLEFYRNILKPGMAEAVEQCAKDGFSGLYNMNYDAARECFSQKGTMGEVLKAFALMRTDVQLM